LARNIFWNSEVP